MINHTRGPKGQPNNLGQSQPRWPNIAQNREETQEKSKETQPKSLNNLSVMILPQVHLRKPCYDFYFL